MTLSINLGFPRIGANRELKAAQESFWAGKINEDQLQAVAESLKLKHWKLQKESGINSIPSNDFTLYDHVLDTSVMFGAVPERYKGKFDSHLSMYFAMARGHQADGVDIPAMEMTKWFDTNYHYIVPEFTPDTVFALDSTKIVKEFLDAKAAGVMTRPVVLGPMSFLLLGKMQSGDVLTLLPSLIEVYAELLTRLKEAGADWVQLDEPILVTDLDVDAHSAFKKAYDRLAEVEGVKILLATYFGALGENIRIATSLPVAGLHIDLVRAPQQLEKVSALLPDDVVLSVGVVNGRNVWRTDLHAALKQIQKAVDLRGTDNVWVGPSCSLLHVPVGLSAESEIDAEIKSWLAFATEKLVEVSALSKACNEKGSLGPEFTESKAAIATRRASSRVHNEAVSERLSNVKPEMKSRQNGYAVRKEAQLALGLPLFPTTTIGSFPQTKEVRAARAEFKSGKRTQSEYDQFLKSEIERTVSIQEQMGLDVLVHGEFERNDMVEYFGERLSGFVFTKNGWVQSYGSRCVKPPVIYGDVSRPQPMTVEWTSFAQSLTQKHMKGMLTGPVTILQWSFVRDDQPRSRTCEQIAFAIRDEVSDLEAAGIRIIQIDEPAIREGLPLRRENWNEYHSWAIGAFRLASSSVKDSTQIHTHMCYSEFNEVIESVAAMDADVVSMETSRSDMELLNAFAKFNYPNEVGPGVYDIHSPRIPTEEEMVDLLTKAVAVIPAEQIWVNPDCGLKTRRWEEVTPALEAMVAAAVTVRRNMIDSSRKTIDAASPTETSNSASDPVAQTLSA